MKRYCKYCYHKDLDNIYEGSEKPLWKYKGEILNSKILLDLYIEKGKLYMATMNKGIWGNAINFCPMCGRKIEPEPYKEGE